MIEIVVVGGGFSGLATAFRIMEGAEREGMDINLTVLEGSKRLGGKVWTNRVDGYNIEVGVNGFLDNKPWTLELCDALGIRDRLMASNDNARKRYIYAYGKLHLLASSPIGFFKSGVLSLKGRLRILKEPFTRKPGPGDETVASFVERHIGREALRNLVGPMVSGVFAGDPYKLSLKSAFPIMAQLEEEGGGSLIKAMVRRMKKAKQMKKEGRAPPKGGPMGPGGILTSFPEGMQFIIDTLEEKLADAVVTGRRVTRVGKSPEGGYTLHYLEEDGTTGSLGADVVVLATPAYACAGILSGLDGEMKKVFEAIPYPPLVVVALGYSREGIAHDLEGFGFLVPYEEGKTILGCLWDSSMYGHRAPEGRVLLRCMVGGARRPETADLLDDALLDAVKRDLRDIMGIEAEPDLVRIYRHDRAIPQYNVGHSEKLERLEERLKEHPGLFLAGNSYTGIGINDCSRVAAETAGKVITYLKKEG
jgi:oxygen-dependent protoporphyrinogen oxidase